MKTLPRTDDLDAFRSDFYRRARPVVLAGVGKRMPAFDRWTGAYLADRLATCRPTVRFEDGRLGRMSMTDFFDYLAAPERFRSSLGTVYLTDFYIRPGFDDAARDAIADEAACPFPRDEDCAEWVSLYAGPAGTGSPLHQDVFGTHTWLAQIAGTKVWRLCDPAELDQDTAKSLDVFGGGPMPCEVWEAELEPGDVIYLPPDWWHQVQNRTTTIAISGNFCSRARARDCLSQVERAPVTPLRDLWLATWREICGTQRKGAA